MPCRKHSAFGFGTFKWIPTEQMEVAVYLRDAGFDQMVIVNNLSGKPVTARVKITAEHLPLAGDTPLLTGTALLCPHLTLASAEVHTMLTYKLAREGDAAVLVVDLEPYRFLWLTLTQPYVR